MKKSIFFYAALTTVALCTVSCSSDDDGDSPYVPQEVVIPEPDAAKAATAFTIPEGQQPTATVAGKTASVEEVNIAESGKTVVKVDVDGSSKYVTYDSKYEKKLDGALYTLTKGGQYKGKIELGNAASSARMRGAAPSYSVRIELKIEIPDDNGNVVTYNVPATETEAEPVQETIPQGTNTSNICRTWVIEQMTLTLKDNKVPGKSKITDFTLTEKSGNLKPLADKAQDEFKSLEDKLQYDLRNDLDVFRSDLERVIAMEIIIRYYYQRGVIAYNMESDKFLDEAVRLLGDRKRYDSILASPSH